MCEQGREAGERRKAKVHNQKQEPHTKMWGKTKSSVAFSKLSKLWDSECRYPSDSPCVTIKNAKVTLPHQHTSPSMQHLGSISFSGLRLQTDLLMKKSSAIECYTRCLVTSTQI